MYGQISTAHTTYNSEYNNNISEDSVYNAVDVEFMQELNPSTVHIVFESYKSTLCMDWVEVVAYFT